MKPVFMRYTKNDIINFIVLLVLGFWLYQMLLNLIIGTRPF